MSRRRIRTASLTPADVAFILDKKARRLYGNKRRLLHDHADALRACDQLEPCQSNFCPEFIRRKVLISPHERLIVQFAHEPKEHLREVQLAGPGVVRGVELARRLRQTRKALQGLTRSPVWVARDTRCGGLCFVRWHSGNGEKSTRGFEVGVHLLCVVREAIAPDEVAQRWRSLCRRHICDGTTPLPARLRVHSVKSRTAVIASITGIDHPVPPDLARVPAKELAPWFDQVKTINKLIARSFSQTRAQAARLGVNTYPAE